MRVGRWPDWFGRELEEDKEPNWLPRRVLLPGVQVLTSSLPFSLLPFDSTHIDDSSI